MTRELTKRGVLAFRAAGVLRPMHPSVLWRMARAGHRLQSTSAASIAIAAAADPAGVAVIDEHGELTWAELDRRVRALAHALVDTYGAGPRRPVALMCRNHRGVLEGLAAAARAGADVLALNTEFAPPQLAAALARRDAAVVVHDEEFAERLEASGDATPRLGPSGWEARARTALDLDDAPGHRSQITILTSGTTGTPKAAARDLPVRAILGAAITLIEQLGLRRGEPVLVAPPLFHGFGLGVAAIAQTVGAPVVVRRQFGPEETLALIERHRVATLVAVPVMLQRILAVRFDAYDTSSLRSVLSAGAPLPPALSGRWMDAFGEILFNGYGSTETGFGAIAGPADLRRAPGTVGRAPLGATVQVLDEARRPALAGHIFVGGDLVIDGYVDGGSKEVAAGLMNTGDLGHVDEHGLLHVDGREDDMIVSGGENVFPQEVENALSAHAGVADVAVIGVPDDAFGQRLVAYIVGAEGTEASEEELLAHVRVRLERYKLPRQIVFLPEIPRTPTGKVIRRELSDAPASGRRG
jgi:fatty-acyl-CoA synthase